MSRLEIESTDGRCDGIRPSASKTPSTERAALVREEKTVEEIHRQQGDEPCDHESGQDLLPEHLPIGAEVVRDVRPGAGRQKAVAHAQPGLADGRVLVTCL